MLTLVDCSELNLSVLKGRFIIGRLCDRHAGAEPSCVGATSANKVFIRRAGVAEQEQVQYLNIDQEVNAICHDEKHPTLVALGTASHLLIYDVADNKIVTSREIENGVGSMIMGAHGDSDEVVVIVGGNCFIQCFSLEGDERFWNVMSDQVTALAFIDFDDDGHNQLVAGTEDGNLRFFKNGRMTMEIKETDAVTFLIASSDQCFAYALANGTVGVYQKRTRLWRVKSKNQIAGLASFDADNDGHAELICAWSHGRFDARSWLTGEVVAKEKLDAKHTIAAFAVADWLQMDHEQLVVCTKLGQVRSYLSSDLGLPAVDKAKEEAADEAMRRLLIKKQNLLSEIEMLQHRPPADEAVNEEHSLDISLMHENNELVLVCETSNGRAIHALILFAEGIFPNGESHAVRFDGAPCSTKRAVHLPVQRNLSADLHINAVVATRDGGDGGGGEVFDVLETVRSLPTFALFRSVPWPIDRTSSVTDYRVKFRLQERIQRVWLWLAQNFILPEADGEPNEEVVERAFEILPSLSRLRIRYTPSDGCFVIETDVLEVAAELVQHLANFFNVQHLASDIVIADDRCRQLMRAMESARELQGVRQRLTVEIADQVNEIRNAFADAESARLTNDTLEMRRCYATMSSGNQQLISHQAVRASNYRELMDRLREVNLHVQHSARCRVGKYQADVVENSRHAIRLSDFDQLLKVTLNGF